MQGINHVEPGGPPLVARLSGSVTMIKVSVGPVDNNAVLLQSNSGASLLIDAANDDDRVVFAVRPARLLPFAHPYRGGFCRGQVQRA